MWFTAVPKNNHGDPIDLIPYDENDEDDLHPAQSCCPDSLSSSLESLASVPSIVPDGDPEEQQSQPVYDNYKDDVTIILRFPDEHSHFGNINNTDGPTDMSVYDDDNSDDLPPME